MKRAPLGAAAFALLAALAWWAWRGEPAGDRAREVHTVPETRDPAAADPVQAPPAPRAMRAAPLPDADVPLRDSLPLLDAAARAGRADAACRLAIELLGCKVTTMMAQLAQPLEAHLRRIDSYPIAEQARERQREAVRRDHARAEAAQAHCAGLPAAGPEPLRYLGIAGRAGHAPSQLYYLSPDALTAGAMLRDPVLAAEYRANAPRFFRAALERGDPRILPLWTAALALPEDTALGAVLPREWQRPGLLQALREEVGTLAPEVPPGAPLRTTPSAEDRAEARRLFETHFRDAAPPPEALDAALMSYEFNEAAQQACAGLAES